MEKITTRKQAQEVINANKDHTCYFSNEISQEVMYDMLRYRMRFGEAETQVIIASLINSGAKFKEEVK